MIFSYFTSFGNGYHFDLKDSLCLNPRAFGYVRNVSYMRRPFGDEVCISSAILTHSNYREIRGKVTPSFSLIGFTEASALIVSKGSLDPLEKQLGVHV